MDQSVPVHDVITHMRRVIDSGLISGPRGVSYAQRVVDELEAGEISVRRAFQDLDDLFPGSGRFPCIPHQSDPVVMDSDLTGANPLEDVDLTGLDAMQAYRLGCLTVRLVEEARQEAWDRALALLADDRRYERWLHAQYQDPSPRDKEQRWGANVLAIDYLQGVKDEIVEPKG